MSKQTVHFSSLKPSRFRLNGIGVEWDEFLHTANCRGAHLGKDCIATDNDFELVCRRAKLLGIRYIRAFYWNRKTESRKGKFCFSEEYQAKRRLFDFCEENGIRVCIVMSEPLCFDTDGNPVPGFCVSDYVDNVMANLDYLLNVRGYTCIQEVTPFNEPNYGARAKVFTVEEYAAVCKLLDEQTRAAGLRDRIRLNLSDTSSMDAQKLFFRVIGSHGDMYNNHNYMCTPDDTDDMLMALPKIGVSFSERLNAPYVIGEFGWNFNTTTFTTSGLDTYLRGLFLPRIVIQSLNSGAVGASYWCFYDTFYGTRKDARMVCGLFAYKDENWRCRPQYYSYGLLMNYADPGAEIFPLHSDTEGIVAVRLRNPDDSRTVFAVNYTENPVTAVFPSDADLGYRHFVFREDALPAGEAMIVSDTVVCSGGGKLTDRIAPMSFAVYTTKQEASYDE